MSTFVSKMNLKAFKILDHVSEERVRDLGLANDQLESATRYRAVIRRMEQATSFMLANSSRRMRPMSASVKEPKAYLSSSDTSSRV